MPVIHKPLRGQTTLEYLLLLAVVAVVVIAGFGQGGLVSQVHDSAQGYYNTVTSVIMGANPQPINGGWCPVTCPPAGSAGPAIMYQACECPAPAFGGTYCPGNGQVNCGSSENGSSGGGVIPCGACPTGQTCNSSGQCACPNGLTCNGQNGSPTGSIPGPGCTACQCPSGTTFSSTNNSCGQNCTQPCTTWNGTSCVPVTCGTNQYCDTTKPASCECQCDQYSYINANGTGCVYCSADSNGNCTTPVTTGGSGACNTGAKTTCQALTGPSAGGCPKNMYCDTKATDSTYNSCQCDENPSNNFCTQYDATTSNCVQVPCCTQNSCPQGQTCNATTGLCS